jgi:DNA-binding Lrp family transcriptional regulator
LDSLDKKILWELITNCRVSYRELGKKVNLSASTVKKRIDNLEEAGFIDHYMVTLNPDLTDARYATLLVSTDASVRIESFKDIALSVDGVYMILPIVDGNFYVSIEYSKPSTLEEYADLLQSVLGVESVEIYDVLPQDAKIGLPEVLDFTRSESIVLSQMMDNPRIADHDIAAQLKWSTKKVKQILQNLEKEKKVAWGLRWNPNLGKGIAFNLVIKYDSRTTDAQRITNWLDEQHPESYFNSRIVESRSTIFAVFDVRRVVDLEPIAMAVLDLQGISSCYAITYYNAILGKTLSRIRLERLLEKEGLWPL